ncbi:MAG: outer membrane beta-barrel protein [Bacteroidales bacterium]
MKLLKHTLISLAAVVLFTLILAPLAGRAQVVNEATKKRISIGVGLFTDIWMTTDPDMKTRTINQGFNVFGTYNLPLGKSRFSFAIGLSISIHNLYWNYRFQGDSLNFQFALIKDDQGYKRSKLTLPYLEIPIEFRYKAKSKFALGIGFKIGYMVYAHSKYVGSDYLFGTTSTLVSSIKNIDNLEKFAYGPTLRIGYKWIHVTGYYSLSKIFNNNGKTPEMYPISLGFVLMPF